MRLAAIFALALSLPVSAQEKGVSWSMVDPFCGQITSTEPETFPIHRAKIQLYKAKSKYLPCCEHAERIQDVRIDGGGNFDLRKVSPGQYWLVASWGKTEVPVALWYDGKHHFACDERYKNVIEIKPSTKTAERLVISSNDSLTNAQTH